MDTSIFIARIIAVIYLSIGVGMLFNTTMYMKGIQKMVDDFSALYMGGFLAIAAGLSIVSYHNVWVSDWTVLVTVLGWLSLVKGVFLLAFPKVFQNFRGLYATESAMNVLKFVVLGLGLVFGYFGFVA